LLREHVLPSDRVQGRLAPHHSALKESKNTLRT
jgi:hypothetical protein